MKLLLLLAIIAVICLAAGSISSKWGVPTLLVFMILGMVFGTDQGP